MELIEFHQKLKAFSARHPNGWISVRIDIDANDGNILEASLDPTWCEIGSKSRAVRASTIAELWVAIEKMWPRIVEEKHAARTRAIALEIIKQHAETGGCNESALRIKFISSHVKDYLAAAIVEANRMADLGPYTVTPAPKSNDPRADEIEAQDRALAAIKEALDSPADTLDHDEPAGL